MSNADLINIASSLRGALHPSDGGHTFDSFFENVEGWVDKRIVRILDAIDTFQLSNNIHGSIAEIGVHHGKFFILLHNKIKNTECSYAIDLFDLQEFNIDKSGKGDKYIFQQNMKKYAKNPDKCFLIQADSLIWDYSDITTNRERINRHPRIFSIDGSHTMEAT